VETWGDVVDAGAAVLPVSYILYLARNPLFVKVEVYVCDPVCRRLEKGLHPGMETADLVSRVLGQQVPTLLSVLVSRCDWVAARARRRRARIYVRCREGTHAEASAVQRRASELLEQALRMLGGR